MRLTPRSVFIALVALGLPFAVTVGWILGSPSRAPERPALAAPGGAGGLGSAPDRAGTSTSRPASPVDYAQRPRVSPSSAPAVAGVVVPGTTLPTATKTSGRRPALSLSPLPPLTDPPVPTPTDIITPPSPSPTESTAPSAEPSSGGIGAGLIR